MAPRDAGPLVTPARRARLRRVSWTALGSAFGIVVLVLPLFDGVGRLLLAPAIYTVAARVFAAALWLVLVAAAWTYEPPR